MRIDWWTLALQTINALVLIWLLARFLFRPVAGIIAERQKTAQALIADAEAAKLVAVQERDKATQETQQLAAAHGEAMKAVATEAAAQKQALLNAAQAEADALRAAAKGEAAGARAEQDKLASERASRLAVDIAAKLLDRLPESMRVSGFVDGLAEGIARLPESARAGFWEDGAVPLLAAPRALSPQEQDQCRAMLATCMKREVPVNFEVDPQLIAGLELRSPHAVVRNSFGAELVRIKEALLDDSHAAS
ncbi:ATP synthase delta (OSCP) subunit [Paraburkholderia xenovorans LB400]|uniref:ATP synthase subunit b n=1 Tax=Paraburkholderia xenovorans (strain LB400) TaxID=266265 RepID=Q13XV8_PARXL|nr:F0F1 ATP synthase subunit delta [Paraburkholderia xenovorans]ABE31081.1 ATP synthase F0 subcomplex B subunit [Paraburkholderia xenovorans LB400]AIP30151.1 ATP synthase delta (OSCP) subunit [Paraburkholderia xenovorans LB400]